LGSGRRTRKSKPADVNVFPIIIPTNSPQVRDSLDSELSKADEKISAAQSDLGQFDVIFQEAEKQYETAAQVLSRATADCERVREDKKEIKARIDEEMNERHDLQARH
jgi:structural maintenance of chromosomes protein 6